MIEFYSDLGQIDPEHICQGELKSEVMFKEDKKYHIDLKVMIFLLSPTFSHSCNLSKKSCGISKWMAKSRKVNEISVNKCVHF